MAEPLAALFRWRLWHLRARAGERARSALLLAPWLLHTQVRWAGTSEPAPGVMGMPRPRGVAAAARRLGLPPPAGRCVGTPQIERVFALQEEGCLRLQVQAAGDLSEHARARLARHLERLDGLWVKAGLPATFVLLPCGAPLPCAVGLHGALLAGPPPRPDGFEAAPSAGAPLSSAGNPLGRALLLLAGGNLHHLWAQAAAGVPASALARPEVAAAHWLSPSTDEGLLARACVSDTLTPSARVALGRQLQVNAACAVRRLRGAAREEADRVLAQDVLQGGFPKALWPSHPPPQELGRVRERAAKDGLWEVSWPDGTVLARGKRRVHARGRALSVLVALGAPLPHVSHLARELEDTRLWVRLLAGGLRAVLIRRVRGGRPTTRVVAKSEVVPALARALGRGARVEISAAGTGQAAEVRRLQRVAQQLGGPCRAEGVAVPDGERTLLFSRAGVRSYASARYGVRPRPPWALVASEAGGPAPARGRSVVSCTVTSVDPRGVQVRLQDASGWWFEQRVPPEAVDDWLSDCREVAAAAPTPAVIAVADGRGATRAQAAPPGQELAVAAHVSGSRVRVSLARADAPAQRLGLPEAAEQLLSAVPVGTPLRVRVRKVELCTGAGGRDTALERLYARSVAWRRLRTHLLRRAGT